MTTEWLSLYLGRYWQGTKVVGRKEGSAACPTLGRWPSQKQSKEEVL